MQYYLKFAKRRELLRLEFNELGRQLYLKYNQSRNINCSAVTDVLRQRNKNTKLNARMLSLRLINKKVLPHLRVYNLKKYGTSFKINRYEILPASYYPIYYRHMTFIHCIRRINGSGLLASRLPIYSVKAPNLEFCLIQLNQLMVKGGLDEFIINQFDAEAKAKYLKMQKLHFILFFQNYILLQHFRRKLKGEID
jgi:hypothetical protein